MKHFNQAAKYDGTSEDDLIVSRSAACPPPTRGPPNDPDLYLYSYADLAAMGYGSRTTIWRLMRAGQFPKPITIGGQLRWTGAQLRGLTRGQ